MCTVTMDDVQIHIGFKAYSMGLRFAVPEHICADSRGQCILIFLHHNAFYGLLTPKQCCRLI